MKLNRLILLTGIAVLALINLSACVQMPTEQQRVVDLRPQISFKFDSADAQKSEARVFIDDLDAGRLGDFVDGKGALRVTSGVHKVRVMLGSNVLLDERAFIGDGISRSFNVR